MPDKGHIELERQIDSITVGVRHRRDLGDMSALMRSIEEVGLLQPITVTPDGVLVCGLRRLEAMRRLGKRTLSVWVRSGISDQLSHLLAQQDENEQRKPLSPVETARLYAEIKVLEKEDSQRRQAATRFGGTGNDGEATVAVSHHHRAERPSNAAQHRHRHRRIPAARADQLDQVRCRGRQPGRVRARVRCQHADRDRQRRTGRSGVQAREGRRRAGQQAAPVRPTKSRTRSPVSQPKRSSASRRRRTPSGCGRYGTRPSAQPRHHSPRSFTLMWSELEGWTALYDVNELAGALKDDEWARFERVVTETIDLRDRLRDARTAAASA